MACATNAISLSLSSNPNSKLSSDFIPKLNKPVNVSLRASTSAELNPGRLFLSRPIGLSRRICANATPVMDQSVGERSSSVPTIVEVDLGNRSYPIYIGSGLLDQHELLQKHVRGKKVLVVTNTTIAPLYLDKVVDALTKGNPNVSVENVILPDGEKYKNMETLMKVFDKAIESRLDRRCTFVALGGGVIGDMCGFAAAAFLRGVNFIQIPTTVMAQVDSSVGGKTGINHPLGKNLIGAFYQPQCVLIDTDTLNTLPDRELASGLAEVIKYGLIRDAEFFEWQEKNMEKLMASADHYRDPDAFAYAIKRSCENKAEVVSLDEKESGLRATLNLGHTFGHAIETGFGYGEWLHGEAVAAGTVMAVDMSYRLGWIDSSIVKRVNDILQRAKLPTDPPETMTVEMFKSVMAVDKKVADGLLRLILLKGPLGNCVFTGEYDRKALDDTLSAFCKAIWIEWWRKARKEKKLERPEEGDGSIGVWEWIVSMSLSFKVNNATLCDQIARTWQNKSYGERDVLRKVRWLWCFSRGGLLVEHMSNNCPFPSRMGGYKLAFPEANMFCTLCGGS
ncbi:hypothetical protein CXB51_031352 [Gossypium anomalum]|uniref:3-dehydroquinate synthase, chloroplastic n=1 Tax=Gossypium anomalum TaxID=47600 RepID=A0A8J6CJD0_9ROSI|nr:hypothetical protein CXB51_031352 [Gossypium anomalum]